VGGLSDVRTVSVSIVDVNEVPQFRVVNATIAENVDVGSAAAPAVSVWDPESQLVTFAVSGGPDAAVFAVNNATGVLSLAAGALDFESASEYILEVSATDSGDLVLAATAVVTIRIVDVNEAPVVAPSTTLYADENQLEVAPALVAYDEDSPSYTRLLWSVVWWGPSAATFLFLSESAGNFSLRRAPDFETRASFEVIVRVTDQGGLFDEGNVTIVIGDVNEAPTFPPTLSREVAENAAVGSDVNFGAGRVDICATDVDAGQTLSYATTATQFTATTETDIDGGACLRLVTSMSFDFEATRVAEVVNITACDDGTPMLCVNGSVSIAVTDVNEAPVMADSAMRCVACALW
jgi:hypothetical protein